MSMSASAVRSRGSADLRVIAALITALVVVLPAPAAPKLLGDYTAQEEPAEELTSPVGEQEAEAPVEEAPTEDTDADRGAEEDAAAEDAADAEDAAGVPVVDDGPAYPIGSLELAYLRENPLHPPLERVRAIEVTLGVTGTGYAAPRAGLESVTYTIGEIDERPVEMYHASAIQHLLETIRDYFVDEVGLLGVFFVPDPDQIAPTGEDLRGGVSDLTIIMTTGIMTEMRTKASGERVAEDGEIEPKERINHRVHRRILERSPFWPFSMGDAERSDLLYQRELDNYLFHLSRHPGRRVDASLAPALEAGGTALDYEVTENRPLVLYGQISNTGTESTDSLRERFGLFHTQLTNNDDIFSLDYYTANFDDVHGFTGSYDRPFENDRVRWRVSGGWSQYTASDVGFFGGDFVGESWFIGGEIVANVFQDRELFVDVFGGIRYEDIRVEDKDIFVEGEEDFLFPYVGVRLDRTTEWFSSVGSVSLEFQSSELSDIDDDELASLGRTLPDEDWVVLRWDLAHSFFLEPLLDPAGWVDPSTPATSTLAHELRGSFRGQYAFDNRLIPQHEQVVGGLYTVRGYPESVVAGDTVIIGSIEYRYHLPRGLEVEPEPRELFGEPFRAAPQYVYGTPDWDLVLKGFFDIGRVWSSDRLFFERDETLVGAGVGVELLYRRNFNVRVDWGFALEDLEAGNVNSGSNRVHVVATILF